MPQSDVLVLAPHPDDAELCCGGTILQLVARGARVVVADMTRGEKGTRGSVDDRARETAAANQLLGLVARIQLGLPDAELSADEAAVAAVVGVVREHRPRVMLAPLDRDLHPDHEATGTVARRAWFVAGLAKWRPELGAAHRPPVFLGYPLHGHVTPTLCLDISAVAERKLAAVRCYASQLSGDRDHLTRLDILERAQARDRYFGMLIGKRAAEPYVADGPVALSDLLALVGEEA